MENKLNMIDRLKFSINPKRYVNYINDKFEKAILYLVIIAVLAGIVQSIKGIIMVSAVESGIKNALKKDESEFEIKNGILDFKASPLKEEAGESLILVDSSKELNDLDSLRSTTVHKDIVTVFLKDGIMFKSPLFLNEGTIKYSELPWAKEKFDNEKLISTINDFKFIKFLIIPIIIVIGFISILINVLLISIIGVLNNLFSRNKMSYGDIFKLSIYSATLPVLINAVFPIGKYIVLIGGFILILAFNFIYYYGNKEKIY